MATQTNIFKQVLEKIPVSSVPRPKNGVVVIPSTDTPYEGFRKLLSNNILSAPVFDVKTQKYSGFLDIRDLVSFVVFVDDDQNSEAPSNLADLVLYGSRMFKVPVDGVTATYLSRRNIFHPIAETDSIWKVCEHLANGLHRVPVLDEKGTLVNIISQSTIIGVLEKHRQDFHKEFSVTIGAINLGTKTVVSVSQNLSAIETFRTMDNKKLSGLAVVDETGKLVGNTSGSDLKLFMNTLSLALLKNPISHFLKIIRQQDDFHVVTISCTSHETLGNVISKLKATKVHRIFIAEEKFGYKPVGVVSLTDILRYIIKL